MNALEEKKITNYAKIYSAASFRNEFLWMQNFTKKALRSTIFQVSFCFHGLQILTPRFASNNFFRPFPPTKNSFHQFRTPSSFFGGNCRTKKGKKWEKKKILTFLRQLVQKITFCVYTTSEREKKKLVFHSFFGNIYSAKVVVGIFIHVYIISIFIIYRILFSTYMCACVYVESNTWGNFEDEKNWCVVCSHLFFFHFFPLSNIIFSTRVSDPKDGENFFEFRILFGWRIESLQVSLLIIISFPLDFFFSFHGL